MAIQTAKSIRRRLEAVNRQYAAHFAGQSRISRDANLLDALVEELVEIERDARRLPIRERQTVLTEIKGRRTLYLTEAEKVRAAQAGGTESLEVHEAATWAYLAIGRYRRHFAGQSRVGRDPTLLDEIIDDLRRASEEVAGLAVPDSEERRMAMGACRESIELYLAERPKILAAQAEGTLLERSERLAGLANAQFALYEAHFANKLRVSRRPALLERMVARLSEIHAGMQEAQAGGVESEHNARNLEIVEGHLARWRSELELIRQEKANATLDALVSGLATAANAVFKTYQEEFGGKDRATRDLVLLCQLFDELYYVGRQMDDIDRVRDVPTNRANLETVLDQLRLFDTEDARIREVQPN